MPTQYLHINGRTLTVEQYRKAQADGTLGTRPEPIPMPGMPKEVQLRKLDEQFNDQTAPKNDPFDPTQTPDETDGATPAETPEDPANPAPAPSQPDVVPPTRAELISIASKLGIKKPMQMKTPDLIEAIAQASTPVEETTTPETNPSI